MAEQVEVGPALEELGEVDFLRLGVDLDADADLAKLPGPPLDRCLVVDVSVVRTVEGDGEAIGITRLRE
jgi:hypothetical protein